MRFKMIIGLLVTLVLVYAFESTATSTETTDFVVPVVVHGNIKEPLHFQTTFRIVSLTGAEVTATLTGFRDDGTAERIFCPGPVIGPIEKVVTVAPNGAANVSTGGDFFNGWAKITTNAPPNALQIYSELSLIDAELQPCPPVICARPSTEIVSSVQLPALQAATEFHAQAIITSQRESAFALVNPSSEESAAVQLRVLDFNGESFDANEFQIPPGGGIRMLLWNLLILNKVFILPPQRPDDFHGSVVITSNFPVSVGAVHVLRPEGKIVNLPVEPTSSL